MAVHNGVSKHAVAPMEVSVEAGNAGEAAWLDDDGRTRRTGTFWTASAHIVTAVIGSGLLSLAWAIAQLGWVAGPAAMLLFAFVTGISIGAVVTSTQKVWHSLQAFGDIASAYSFSNLIEIQDTIKAPPPSESKVVQKATRLSVATVTIFYMLCKSSGTPCTIFGVVQLLFPLILEPDFDQNQISWLSIVAAIMSLTCSSIELSILDATAANGGFMGSLTAISIGIISTQRIWHTLRVNLCVGRRAQTTPRTGAVKGLGRSIGRAQEEVPAGRSHGIPTFQRTGDCSLSPHNCDWFPILGCTLINTDGSCVISSSVMCMEAQHRRLSGKYHGADSCRLKVTPEAVESLKKKCKKRGAWKPDDGAPTVEGVLEVILSLKEGLPTVPDNVSLRLKSYVTFKARKLSPLKVTSMIQKKGPVIGVLYAGGETYLRSTVYRGDRAFPANHAVLCTGYRYVDGELCIIIMDNWERVGPFRFVLHEAFKKFHVLTCSRR